MATREERTVQLDVISATDLQHVKAHGNHQDAYAVAYVYPEDEQHTAVDKHGGLNPVWNSKLRLTMDENPLQRGYDAITIEVRCKTSVIGHKSLGVAKVPLSSLPEENAAPRQLAVELRLKSGETHGIVNVSVALSEKRRVPYYETPSWEKAFGPPRANLIRK